MPTSKPNKGTDSRTDDTPPARAIYIEGKYGPGAFDKADTQLFEQDSRIDYTSGLPCGGDQISCNHTTGLTFLLRPGTAFWPVMLGFKVHSKVGGVLQAVTQGTPVELVAGTAQTYPWVDTSGANWTYYGEFKVYRKVPGT